MSDTKLFTLGQAKELAVNATKTVESGLKKDREEESKIPLKIESAAATSLFKLTYRAGSKCEHKVFRFDGVLADAIVRSREHCTKMGIRFIHCEYFAVDLSAQEETKEAFAKQVF